MAYTDASEVRKVLDPSSTGVQPATDNGTAAWLSDAQIGEAIEEADQEIDAALGHGWSTPFTPTPPIVARISRDLTAWLAHLTYNKSRPIDRDDPVRLRSIKAQTLLDKAQTGAIDISDTAPVATERESAVVNPLYGDTSMFPLSDFGLGVGVRGGQP